MNLRFRFTLLSITTLFPVFCMTLTIPESPEKAFPLMPLLIVWPAFPIDSPWRKEAGSRAMFPRPSPELVPDDFRLGECPDFPPATEEPEKPRETAPGRPALACRSRSRASTDPIRQSVSSRHPLVFTHTIERPAQGKGAEPPFPRRFSRRLMKTCAVVDVDSLHRGIVHT